MSYPVQIFRLCIYWKGSMVLVSSSKEDSKLKTGLLINQWIIGLLDYWINKPVIELFSNSSDWDNSGQECFGSWWWQHKPKCPDATARHGVNILQCGKACTCLENWSAIEQPQNWWSLYKSVLRSTLAWLPLAPWHCMFWCLVQIFLLLKIALLTSK